MMCWSFASSRNMKQKINNEPINQELSEILTKYYDGSFTRLVQEYIRIAGITEEEKEALVEAIKFVS